MSAPQADSAEEDDDEPTCRICFGGEEDGELIEPCRCAGSMALIHRSCLDAVRVSGFDPSSLPPKQMRHVGSSSSPEEDMLLGVRGWLFRLRAMNWQ